MFVVFAAAALGGLEVWAARFAWPVDPSWYRLEESGGVVTFGCQNFRPQRFAAEPPRGQTRVFLLGGSAAFGFPDRPIGDAPLTAAGHGIGGAIQATLDAASPGTFELVNLGVNGGTSEDTLRLARRAMAWHPSAFVVYDGNNEFMDVPRNMSPPLWQFALYRRTAVLREKVRAAPGWVGAPAWTTERAAEAVHARLRHDLTAVAELAADAGIPLILTTQATNLADFDPSWSTAGKEADLRSLPRRSDQEVESLYAATPSSAELAWTAGRRRLRSGGDALAALQAAVDHDGMAFRPTSIVNDTIRAVAKERSAVLVDAASESEPGRRAPGADEFYDWVHPRPEEARVIGGAIVAGLTQAGTVQEAALPAIAAPPLPDTELAARDVRVAVSWVQWACVRAYDPTFRLENAAHWAGEAALLEPANKTAAGLVELIRLLGDPSASPGFAMDTATATKLAAIHPCVAARLAP